jgi:hypothetical protein
MLGQLQKVGMSKGTVVDLSIIGVCWLNCVSTQDEKLRFRRCVVCRCTNVAEYVGPMVLNCNYFSLLLVGEHVRRLSEKEERGSMDISG